MDDFSFSVFPNEELLDFRLFQCGREQCKPLHSFGPFVRNHYLFHYIISGQGFLEANAKKGVTQRYDLEAGQGFLITPGQINTYSADQLQPWKYVWLEFDGLRVAEYLNEAGLSAAHPVYQPKTAGQAERVRDIMLYMTDHAKASPLHLIGHLCLFLDALIQTSSARREPRETQLRDFYIQEAVSYMELNYQRELTVEEIAGACQLNRSYFSKLFKEKKGCPPQEFLIRLRLTKAAELMKQSTVSIGDISASCGYPNQLHFSRAFKQRYGVSPREWRAQNKIQGKH
ncbi:AraC family transcriptional regulator [uncultured Oscillibacter sp.]|uniref:AraC family transcriptional regulator n=1 Tax=uncultured Oscillibacter sp. TaxID=876091 RepID=UPI0025E6CED7|nr:AraC family transcriptional regulator [uncultured Oscillibacter sp.]